MLTLEERAALERLRTSERVFAVADLTLAASIALRDYPADDDCSLSRQELIEELDAARETINNMGTEIALLTHPR